jgi:hypothetical protein
MSFSYGQKNTIYAELFGNGIFGSINYERQITSKPIIFARVGVGLWSNLGILGSSNSGYTIPTSVNYLLDLSNNNFFDFGIGSTFVRSNFVSNNAPKFVAYLFTSIGYRRHFGNNLFFGFHITPYVNNLTDNSYKLGNETIFINQEFDFNTTQWFGIRFGKRF